MPQLKFGNHLGPIHRAGAELIDPVVLLEAHRVAVEQTSIQVEQKGDIVHEGTGCNFHLGDGTKAGSPIDDDKLNLLGANHPRGYVEAEGLPEVLFARGRGGVGQGVGDAGKHAVDIDQSVDARIVTFAWRAIVGGDRANPSEVSGGRGGKGDRLHRRFIRFDKDDPANIGGHQVAHVVACHCIDFEVAGGVEF